MGFFSWITQDTGRSISNKHSERPTFRVVMTDNKGNRWEESDYDGYGVFGGKDYYVLLDEMNGGVGNRTAGIDLAFSGKAFISPSLSEWGWYYDGVEPEQCEHQGFFYESVTIER